MHSYFVIPYINLVFGKPKTCKPKKKYFFKYFFMSTYSGTYDVVGKQGTSSLNSCLIFLSFSAWLKKVLI